MYGRGRGLQGRGRPLRVAPRTGSYAFPRDLRGPHPGHHGGDGETLQDRLPPGQGDAAQREGVGKQEQQLDCILGWWRLINRAAVFMHG